MPDCATNLPVIGVTIGDPGGIGPEITLKALLTESLRGVCLPVAIGDPEILTATARHLGMHVSLKAWSPGMPPLQNHGRDTILVHGTASLHAFPQWGGPSLEGGRHALTAIESAVALVKKGAIAAITTAPVSKESLSMAGCGFLGHTDFLASLCGVKDYAMMLSAGSLHVVHATIHLPLAKAIAELNSELILRRIRMAAGTASRLRLGNRTVAVCGLNPHAGENGLLGGEEKQIIEPAVTAARLEHLPVAGPYPADTIFYRALRGEFSMIVALYHDQGHIPIKLLGFMEGVNTTLGLPFIRTSVDHGTAFKKAGKGTADPGSLLAAIRMAASMAAADPREG